MTAAIVPATGPQPSISTAPAGVSSMLLNLDPDQAAAHVIRSLPPRAKLRVAGLTDSDMKSHALRRQVRAELAKLDEQQNSVSNLRFHRDRDLKASGFVESREVKNPKTGEIKTVKVDSLAAFDLELAEIKARKSELHAIKFPRAEMQDVREYLAARAARTFVDANVPLVAPRKGETPLDMVERTRAAVDKLKTTMQELERAPRPADEVKAKIARDLDRLEKAGTPRLGSIFRGGYIRNNGQFDPGDQPGATQIRWPEKYLGFASEDHEGVLVADSTPLLVWLQREAIQAKLFSMVDARDLSGALTIAAKRVKIAELNAAIRLAEHAEESAVLFALDQGMQIERRPTHPLVLLGVDFESAAPVAKPAPVVTDDEFEGDGGEDQ